MNVNDIDLNDVVAPRPEAQPSNNPWPYFFAVIAGFVGYVAIPAAVGVLHRKPDYFPAGVALFFAFLSWISGGGRVASGRRQVSHPGKLRVGLYVAGLQVVLGVVGGILWMMFLLVVYYCFGLLD